MSKYCTDAGQGHTFTEHGCGCGMPQDMCTINGRFNPGPKQRRTYDMGNGRSCERAKRSEYGSEYLGSMQRWPTLTYIKQNRVANLLVVEAIRGDDLFRRR